MTELKVARIPDRTPVRIAISVPPELHRALTAYAELYRKRYGDAESVADLIPFMLECFLDSDRGFARARREMGIDGASAENQMPRAVRRNGQSEAEPTSPTRSEA